MDAALDECKSIKVFGNRHLTPDGTCIRDYIHVNDLAMAHMLAMEKLLETGVSSDYNLGNGKGYSVMEIIEMVKKISGREIRVEITEKREGDADIVIGSSEKANKELGWVPQYKDIESMLSTAWNWHVSRDKRHQARVA